MNKTLNHIIWNPDHHSLVCRAVRDEAPDVKTFVFAGDVPSIFHYRPGQYLTFDIEANGRSFSRSYTLSSAPSRPDLVAITVKRIGEGSTLLHDRLRAGSILRASRPLGTFSYSDHPGEKYLMLAGGIGITPMMSMLRTMSDREELADVVLVYSAHSEADFVFARELNLIAHSSRNLRIVYLCSRSRVPEAQTTRKGRLTSALLSELVSDFRDRQIFSCGPPSYLTETRGIVAHHDLGTDRYHEELFRLERPAAGSSPAPIVGGKQFSITFARSQKTVQCGADQFILTAALMSGVNPASACAEGICGTCRTRLISGEVDMQHQGGIRARDIARGDILICCSKPRSDVVIDA